MGNKYINNNSKKIIIIFQSAGRIPIEDLKKILVNEVSEETISNHHKRYTWMRFANANLEFDYLFIEDYYSKCYGWYMIDSGRIIIDDINKWLNEFFLDKNYEQVIAFGSSKGGTAALLYGIINQNITHVFSLVPQIEVAVYLKQYYKAYQKLFYGTDNLENNESVLNNQHLLNTYLYDNSTNILNNSTKFVLYTGINDKQFKQIIKFYNLINNADNFNLIINIKDYTHDPLVFENLAFIYEILKNIDNNVNDILTKKTIKINNQIYLYKND